MRTLLLRMVLVPTFIALFSLSNAFAQEEGDDTNKRPSTPFAREPGRGPQIPFDELRWEFWWFFNKEPLIALRDTLTQQKSGQAGVDAPFQKLTQDDRVKILVQKLVFTLRDSNPQVRSAAVIALAKTQEPSARAYLKNLVEDKEFPVRLDAILSLGISRNTVFLKELETLVSDEKLELQARFHAAIAIGLIGGTQARESFRLLLAPTTFRTIPPQVQAGLAYAVGVARDPDNVNLVRSLLADKSIADPIVRAYLVLALGKSGTDADVADILSHTTDSDAQVRRSAVIGLGVTLRKKGGAGNSAEAVKKLTTLSHGDVDVMVRNLSYISLGWIGGPDAMKLLHDDFGRSNKSQQTYLALALGLSPQKENVALLTKAFETESDTSAKGAFAIALGLHRDAAASPVLREHFQKAGEPVLKGYIGLALGMLRDVDSTKHLRDAFMTGNDVEMLPNLATALGLIGSRPAVTEILARAKKEPNEFVKQSMLYSLGLIGDRAALEPLAQLIQDEKDVAYVRTYSSAALGLLGEERPIRTIATLSIDSNYTVRQTFLDLLFQSL